MARADVEVLLHGAITELGGGSGCFELAAGRSRDRRHRHGRRIGGVIYAGWWWSR